MRWVTVCTPVAHAAKHPKAVVKALIHDVARKASHPVHQVHHTVAHAVHRHAYVIPKVVAQAKVATVCTVLGIAGGLGVGAGAGGLPSFDASSLTVPFIALSPPHTDGSTGPTHPQITVPEPSSLLLLASASAALLWVSRRRPAGSMTRG